MNIESVKKNIQSLGLYNFIIHLFVRLFSKLTYSNVLVGMILSEESLDPKYLEVDSRYSCRFLSNEEVYLYSQNPENDLPLEFVDQALKNSDLCYAILDGSKLASYGWYTNCAAIFIPELRLHFNKEWIYMYRGYTLPAYRGQRLHAVGMARAMKSFVERGFNGLISYVEASNFNSLKSVYRMGYQQIGKIIVVKFLSKYLSLSSGKCSNYGLCLKDSSIDKSNVTSSELAVSN